jgi:NitT/TauT family transport system ATP-binding protein
VEDVSISYFQGNIEYKVMSGVSFNVYDDEFVSIIGPSGCGKSSLIRTMIGLQQATRGRIEFNGRQVTGPPYGMSMIFQGIALIPWKTALENVKLALINSSMSEKEKDKRCFYALNQVKLQGFETAYPSELSGGMRQRVGVARALVSGPELLLMDEPFSSLDELTAEQLREEVHDILRDEKLRVRSVIMVSHNVDEVVELSDRIIVLSKPPSRIVDDIRVNMEYPRDKQSKGFGAVTDRIFKDLYAAEV